MKKAVLLSRDGDWVTTLAVQDLLPTINMPVITPLPPRLVPEGPPYQVKIYRLLWRPHHHTLHDFGIYLEDEPAW